MHPSTNPHTIANYSGHKIGRKGTVLHDMDGKVVHDVNNKKMLCVEDWKAPVNYEQFSSAMSKSHKKHTREGPFQPSCDNCFKTYFTEGLKTGCTHHHCDPHLLNSGNPRNAIVVEESLKKFVNPHYEAKSDTALSPVELKRLFDFLFTAWNIYKLQFWVMALMSMHLFLRGDEIVNICFFQALKV